MYTAKLIKKDELVNEIRATIEYSNGVDSFQETMTTNGSFRTVEQLKQMVEDKLDRLNAQAEISSVLVEGAEIEKPIVEVETKTVDEIAFETFMTDYRRLKTVKDFIDLGVLTGTETAVVALKNKVKTRLKIEYIDKL